MRVGIDASGYSRWFERLLAELGKELHRTVPSQLEGTGNLDGGVSQLGRSAGQPCLLDREVQSRPASSRRPRSHPARGPLGFRRCTYKRGSDCLNWRGALHTSELLCPLCRWNLDTAQGRDTAYSTICRLRAMRTPFTRTMLWSIRSCVVISSLANACSDFVGQMNSVASEEFLPAPM